MPGLAVDLPAMCDKDKVDIRYVYSLFKLNMVVIFVLVCARGFLLYGSILIV